MIDISIVKNKGGLEKYLLDQRLKRNSFPCRFTGLVPYAFKTHGYTSLKVLYLRNNSIINIHVEAFLKLDSLHTLDLSNNMLNAVPSEALYVLPYLHNLNLASNNLMLIPDFAFQGIPTLKQLDLSGNRISDFETKALSGLTSLQVCLKYFMYKVKIIFFIVVNVSMIQKVNTFCFGF